MDSLSDTKLPLSTDTKMNKKKIQAYACGKSAGESW
jgi:hypothetical protein